MNRADNSVDTYKASVVCNIRSLLTANLQYNVLGEKQQAKSDQYEIIKLFVLEGGHIVMGGMTPFQGLYWFPHRGVK